MEKDIVWENKKYVRYSLQYYKWLLSVCEKRNLSEGIWVYFSKHKSGLFNKEKILKNIAFLEKTEE